MGIIIPTQGVSGSPAVGMAVATRALPMSLRTSGALRTFQSINLTVSSDAAALPFRGRFAELH